MKKNAIIITFAAALCALTSCGRELASLPEMAASPGDNTSAAAISASIADTSYKAEKVAYEDIAVDLVERFYEMRPQFMYRFISYSDPSDTVTFRLADPFANRDVRDVVFAHISGKGFEFNSINDLMDYRKTVLSEEFAAKYSTEECTEISGEYNSGDYIDESDVDRSDLLYYKSYIMYKGRMYTNTTSPQIGYIGHMAPNESVIITDVTDTSFRAYYPSVYGQNGDISSLCCDIVDFILDPVCGEWRINDFVSDSYEVFVNKAEEMSVSTEIKDTELVSADTYKAAAQRESARISEYRNSTSNNNNTSAQNDITESGVTPAQTETPAADSFTPGVSNGIVYTSDYAGIKITLPEDGSFLNEADLDTHYIMPTRFMTEEERTFYKTGVLDATACYSDAIKRVDVWFYNTKQRFPDAPGISAEEFMQCDELVFDPEIEVTDIGNIETVNICGKNYARACYTSFSQNRVSYVRRIDDDYIMVIRTSGIAPAEFESIVSPAV